MGKAVRVNLSVPVAIDDVLTRLSAASGISKASLVMDSVARAFPFWRDRLAHFERGRGRDPVASGGAAESVPGQVDSPRLTRAERKRLEREARLKGKGGKS